MNRPSSSSTSLPESLLSGLRDVFGDRFSTAYAVREHHGRDESRFDPIPPDAVVFPESNDEVVAAIRLCSEHRIPVIAYGAGTSLEGHLLAVQGGVTIDFSRMKRVLSLHAEDLTATVQAGVTRKELNQALKDTGLFFPVDPGADASLGGMTATRASGTNAVRYGTMRENVLALTAVTADGRTVRTGMRARKSAAGYDLTRLFVGSEGTLGVITEVTVRLYPQPEAVSAAICSFASTREAVDTVMHVMQSGVPVARAEFLDGDAVKAINMYCSLGLPQQPLLLFEFHGSGQGVAEQAEAVQAIAREHGAIGFEWAMRPEERSRLWAARHHAYFAVLQMRPGVRAITTDCCVPISRLAECVLETKADCERSGIVHSVIGHAGDGNFHVMMLVDPNDSEEIERAEMANARMVDRAIAMDGTCTGEHGIGLHKMDFLVREHGEEGVALMRTLKHALDPHNIMNPGKVLRF